MRYRKLVLISAAVALAVGLGCGAGHAKLTAVAVSPSTATASSATHATVGFSAQGTLTNNTTRGLSGVDGLSWKTSNTAMATIDGGTATCITPGTVTITGTAPIDLQLTVNNGVQNTSPTLSGTATLTCT